MANILTLAAGLIFGFGLALSGMTHPEKVLSFLDVTGKWDPSLLFVLGGAVGVTTLSFRFVLKRKSPLFASAFLLPDVQTIDRPLLIGSALFGLGWGISGYCPGPAVALLASPNRELWIFMPALLAGYVLQHHCDKRTRQQGTPHALAENRNASRPPACG